MCCFPKFKIPLLAGKRIWRYIYEPYMSQHSYDGKQWLKLPNHMKLWNSNMKLWNNNLMLWNCYLKMQYNWIEFITSNNCLSVGISLKSSTGVGFEPTLPSSLTVFSPQRLRPEGRFSARTKMDDWYEMEEVKPPTQVVFFIIHWGNGGFNKSSAKVAFNKRQWRFFGPLSHSILHNTLGNITSKRRK